MKSTQKAPLDLLEQDLLRSLRPVQPDPVFISRLHANLSVPSSAVIERRPSPAASMGMFVLGIGLAVGLLLVWIIRGLRQN